MIYVACSNNNSPTAPSNPGPGAPTFTPTETALCAPYYRFGKSVIGGTHGGGFATSNLFCNRFNLSASGTVYRLHAYLQSVPTPGAIIQGALYSNGGSAPLSLLGQSVTQTAVTGWNTLDIPATILASGTYWLAVASNSGMSFASNGGSGTNTGFNSFNTTFSNNPSGGATGEQISIYADYCP